ncbi:RluA family pseudouridine synthase [Tissierellaceae bacterium HCP3S3_D8]
MDLFQESESIIIFNCKEDDIDLEEFLYKQNLSGRLFRRLYRQKFIYINGKVAKKRCKLKVGDIVSISMEEEVNDISPEKMELNIIYEDMDLLILNKDHDIVVHPTKSHQSNTLSNGIAYYFREKNIKKKIRFVNRLDMDTTGILVVAKNPFAHQQMAIQFENNTVEKRYLTLVHGIVEKDEEIIDKPIGRDGEGNIKKIVTPDGQRALTKYIVKERLKDSTLLEVQIFTGRSHQIRVHLEHIGHPIIGDILYNEKSTYIERQALHSCFLGLVHPRTKMPIEFTAPLPEDMIYLIEHMKK